MSQGFIYTSDLEIYQEETKAKRVLQKNIGKLSVTLSLINEKQAYIPEIKPIETKEQDIKSYLLYLYLDHITKLKIPKLNLFITYKTFPEPERITTDIM